MCVCVLDIGQLHLADCLLPVRWNMIFSATSMNCISLVCRKFARFLLCTFAGFLLAADNMPRYQEDIHRLLVQPSPLVLSFVLLSFTVLRLAEHHFGAVRYALSYLVGLILFVMLLGLASLGLPSHGRLCSALLCITSFFVALLN